METLMGKNLLKTERCNSTKAENPDTMWADCSHLRLGCLNYKTIKQYPLEHFQTNVCLKTMFNLSRQKKKHTILIMNTFVVLYNITPSSTYKFIPVQLTWV